MKITYYHEIEVISGKKQCFNKRSKHYKCICEDSLVTLHDRYFNTVVETLSLSREILQHKQLRVIVRTFIYECIGRSNAKGLFLVDIKEMKLTASLINVETI